MQMFSLPCKAHSAPEVKKLIICFAGWSMDEKPFLHMMNHQYDVVIFYDYTTFRFNGCAEANCLAQIITSKCLIYNLFNKYNEINIIAWSMGVWGASMSFNQYCETLCHVGQTSHGKLFKKLKRCIAINGTLFPISTTWGIPQDIYDKTLENLPAGFNKFNLRMCGSKNACEKYMACAPTRSIDNIKDELAAIKEHFFLCNSLKWDTAIISTNDHIFPAKNQRTFWEDYLACTPNSQNNCFERDKFRIIEIEDAHYPFFRWNTWDEIIEL